jgi:glyoxylase-like metal-dependent hydrolase (beta-lactamase superfamily II)
MWLQRSVFRKPLVPMFCAAVLLGTSALLTAQNPAASAPQGVPDTAPIRVSEHTYALVGFPNIGIIVGNRATLVVDTGMGIRNGAVVVRQAEKLAMAPNLYLTTTHFHPEHTTGEQAFPPRTVLIRSLVQQQELEQRGAEYVELFRNRSAQNKELLQDVKLRTPDIVFDREVVLDLGGVTVRLFYLGPAHTRGDELIFVEGDSVLLPGDIVQDRLVPNMPNEDASVKGWLANLDQLALLKPRFVVPDHGSLGDGSLVGKERAFLAEVQQRAQELKRQGKTVEDAGSLLTTELRARYPDWQSLGAIPNVVRRVYAESP